MLSFSKLMVLLGIGLVVLLILRTAAAMQSRAKSDQPRKRQKKRPARNQGAQALIQCKRCGLFHSQGHACPECGS